MLSARSPSRPRGRRSPLAAAGGDCLRSLPLTTELKFGGLEKKLLIVDSSYNLYCIFHDSFKIEWLIPGSDLLKLIYEEIRKAREECGMPGTSTSGATTRPPVSTPTPSPSRFVPNIFFLVLSWHVSKFLSYFKTRSLIYFKSVLRAHSFDVHRFSCSQVLPEGREPHMNCPLENRCNDGQILQTPNFQPVSCLQVPPMVPEPVVALKEADSFAAAQAHYCLDVRSILSPTLHQ